MSQHYENMPMQYTVTFKVVKKENFQNYFFFVYFSYFVCELNKNSAEVDIAPASGKIHITMQGFTLTAINDTEKTELRRKN